MEEIDRADEPTNPVDPVNDLREECKRFIAQADVQQAYRANALSKMDEMIFWIRAGMGRK